MGAVGFDAKSILRDQVVRQNGTVERRRGMGFNSHLGTAVAVRDPKALGVKLRESLQAHAEDFGISIRTPFLSAQRLRQLHFPESHQHGAMAAFLHQVVEDLSTSIESLRFTWLALARTEQKIAIRRGQYPKLMDWHQFHGTVQTFGSMLAASDYVKSMGVPDEVHVDHFESRVNYAWKDLHRDAPHAQIVATGDEVNPIICAADFIGYLTNHMMDVQSRKLVREDLVSMWDDKGFRASARYWTRQHLPWIEWRSNQQVPLANHYPRPMTFVLMDRRFGLLNGDESRPIRYALEAQPLVDVPLTHAASVGGGFKFWAGKKDLPALRDGDVVAYAGTESQRLAQDLATTHALDVVSIRELRQRLKPDWAMLG